MQGLRGTLRSNGEAEPVTLQPIDDRMRQLLEEGTKSLAEVLANQALRNGFVFAMVLDSRPRPNSHIVDISFRRDVHHDGGMTVALYPTIINSLRACADHMAGVYEQTTGDKLVPTPKVPPNS